MLNPTHRVIELLVFGLFITGCSAGNATGGGSEIPDRQLAWCLGSPGAITAVAKDHGISVPEEAQAAIDDGIFDSASRWRFHDAWGGSIYISTCLSAYDQFHGADDDVDMTVLASGARVPTPAPTANLSTATLRVRARELISRLSPALKALKAAFDSAAPSVVKPASAAVMAITKPELDALQEAVAERCFEKAGAAYGKAIDHANLAASEAQQWADGGDQALLELADSFLSDALTELSEFERLDAAARC